MHRQPGTTQPQIQAQLQSQTRAQHQVQTQGRNQKQNPQQPYWCPHKSSDVGERNGGTEKALTARLSEEGVQKELLVLQMLLAKKQRQQRSPTLYESLYEKTQRTASEAQEYSVSAEHELTQNLPVNSKEKLQRSQTRPAEQATPSSRSINTSLKASPRLDQIARRCTDLTISPAARDRMLELQATQDQPPAAASNSTPSHDALFDMIKKRGNIALRSDEWAANRDGKLEKQRRNREMNQLTECTFRPLLTSKAVLLSNTWLQEPIPLRASQAEAEAEAEAEPEADVPKDENPEHPFKVSPRTKGKQGTHSNDARAARPPGSRTKQAHERTTN
jgi:hypothetical protein